MDKYGFVYIWYDRKHKRFYIGCHWGIENDDYVCSSAWMMQAYKKRPQDFKRRILSTGISCRKDLLEEEYRWLSMIKSEELKVRYYNLRVHRYGHYSTDTTKATSVNKKISETLKKVNAGKMPSEATRIGASKFSSRPKSEETKERLRKANLGKKRSKESSLKKSEAMKERWTYGSHLSEDGRQRFIIKNKKPKVGAE
jgi:hypothetical protein